MFIIWNLHVRNDQILRIPVTNFYRVYTLVLHVKLETSKIQIFETRQP